MLRAYGVIRESAQRIGKAAGRAVGDLQEGHVQQEPHITDRMLGRMTEAMDEFEVKGVRWKALTLTDRGPSAQEHEYGADFMGALNIELPGYQVNKGFLAQAKLIRPGHNFSANERRRLQAQCEKMLRLSPASFVFLYSKNGISVVPAVSIVGAETDPTELYSRTVTRFFEEHFESFIGDQRISFPDPRTLSQLRSEYNARTALLLQARGPGSESEGIYARRPPTH